MLEILSQYGFYYWQGILYTIALSFFSLIAGTLLGYILSHMRLSKSRILKGISGFYIWVVRGTPMFIQLYIVHIGLFDLLKVSLNPFISGLIAVSINSAAYVAEIFRSGIQSVGVGQIEAGRSLGLSEKQTMKEIVLPQAIKNILPALGNEFITLIKETAIVSSIGVYDLMWGASKVQQMTYKTSALTLAAIFYLLITTFLTFLLSFIEKKVNHEC